MNGNRDGDAQNRKGHIVMRWLDMRKIGGEKNETGLGDAAMGWVGWRKVGPKKDGSGLGYQKWSGLVGPWFVVAPGPKARIGVIFNHEHRPISWPTRP